jgi:hypothetical protein
VRNRRFGSGRPLPLFPTRRKSAICPPIIRLNSEACRTLVLRDPAIVHGRFSNNGLPKNWIAANIVRIAHGVIAERWDVPEDEATRAESQSGLPMLVEKFPE